jgi:hypothetical protein
MDKRKLYLSTFLFHLQYYWMNFSAIWSLEYTQNFKNSIFWSIIPCSPLKVNWHFGGTCQLHLHGWRVSQTRNDHGAGSLLVSFLVYSLNMKMEVTCSLKMSVDFQITTWYCILEKKVVITTALSASNLTLKVDAKMSLYLLSFQCNPYSGWSSTQISLNSPKKAHHAKNLYCQQKPVTKMRSSLVITNFSCLDVFNFILL